MNPDRVEYRAEDYWEKYTPTQLDTVYKLCALLADNYPIDLVVGHEEIAGFRGEPIGTTLSRLHRGLKRLREMMER